MYVTAWNNGASVYGIRVGYQNRDLHFDRSWTHVEIEMDGRVERFNLTPGFWNDCPEFRDSGPAVIREWLTRRNLETWPVRRPPRFWLHHDRLNVFSLVEIPSRDELETFINSSLDELIEHHYELLDLVVGERSFTRQFASLLRRFVPREFHVDVEYNRHEDLPKILNLPRRDASDIEVRATTVFPDVIVHVRNTDEANLLVLEVKKPGESLEYDEAKLIAFREQLDYVHTAHLICGLDRNGRLVRDLRWVDA
jgi:hypothetical protein